MNTLTHKDIISKSVAEVASLIPFLYQTKQGVEIRVTGTSGSYFLATPRGGSARRVSLEDIKKNILVPNTAQQQQPTLTIVAISVEVEDEIALFERQVAEAKAEAERAQIRAQRAVENFAKLANVLAEKKRKAVQWEKVTPSNIKHYDGKLENIFITQSLNADYITVVGVTPCGRRLLAYKGSELVRLTEAWVAKKKY